MLSEKALPLVFAIAELPKRKRARLLRALIRAEVIATVNSLLTGSEAPSIEENGDDVILDRGLLTTAIAFISRADRELLLRALLEGEDLAQSIMIGRDSRPAKADIDEAKKMLDDMFRMKWPREEDGKSEATGQ